MYKRLLLAAVLGGVFVSAQQTRAFVSADHGFDLTIPAEYIAYKSDFEKHQMSYIPVCQDGDSVCVAYDGHKYDGTNFGAASVEVKVSRAAASTCATPFGKTGTKNIGGIAFVHSTEMGAAMSHDIEKDIYRGSVNGTCYEMYLNLTYTVFEVYEPGTIRKFTDKDHSEVKASLMRIAESFKLSP